MTDEPTGDTEVMVITGLPFSRLRQIHPHPDGWTPGNQDTPGDCYRTVIACLLDAPTPTYLPHFVAEASDSAWESYRLARTWLRSELELDLAGIEPEVAADLGVAYMASVPSKRGPWSHVVVAVGSEVVWDPSGRDDYTLDEIQGAEVIVRPYSPTPDAQVAEWRATSADGQEEARTDG